MANSDGNSLDEWLDSFSEEQKTEILTLAEQDIADYGTILKFREIKELVRQSLATEFALGQTDIRDIEKQTDLLLTTFKKVIETMEGKFRVILELSNHRTYDLLKLRDDYENLEGTPLGPFYEEEDLIDGSNLAETLVDKGDRQEVNEKLAA